MTHLIWTVFFVITLKFNSVLWFHLLFTLNLINQSYPSWFLLAFTIRFLPRKLILWVCLLRLSRGFWSLRQNLFFLFLLLFLRWWLWLRFRIWVIATTAWGLIRFRFIFHLFILALWLLSLLLLFCFIFLSVISFLWGLGILRFGIQSLLYTIIRLMLKLTYFIVILTNLSKY